jgi:hypothetical protein
MAAEPGTNPARSRGGAAQMDRRTRRARRFAAIVAELQVEVGGDLSPSVSMAIDRAAALALAAEEMRAALVRGEAISADDLVRLSNAAARELNALRRGMASRKPALGGQGRLAQYLAERSGRPSS